jgi:hypothetical protein
MTPQFNIEIHLDISSVRLRRRYAKLAASPPIFTHKVKWNMLEVKVPSGTAESAHPPQSLTAPHTFPVWRNHFRITSLYKHKLQLPWNHILAKNRGGRVPRQIQFPDLEPVPRPSCAISATNRRQIERNKLMIATRIGTVVESNLLERCSNMNSALT